MKRKLLFLAAIYLTVMLSISASEWNTPILDGIAIADTSQASTTTIFQEVDEFSASQDSIRQLLVSRIGNPIVLNSILEEFVIRKGARVVNDSVYFDLGFNLHGLDCGAPDCYTTVVSFAFKLGNAVKFPQYLVFRENESGCVEVTYDLENKYKLIVQNAEEVIYHCAELNRTLALYKNRTDGNENVYYFTYLQPNQVNSKSIRQLLLNYDADQYPYRSTSFTRAVYEDFLD